MIITYFLITNFKKERVHFRKKISFSEGLLFTSIVVLIILNTNIYGQNLLDYGQIRPSIEKVIDIEDAKYNALYQREINLKNTLDERQIMPLQSYLIKYIYRVGQTTFGICGHKNLVPSSFKIVGFYGLLLLSVILYLLRYRTIPQRTELNIALFSILTYSLIVMYVNYATYIDLRLFGLALQGRYNFPVISLITIFIAYNLFYNLRERGKVFLLSILAIYLVFNNYIWFITDAGHNLLL